MYSKTDLVGKALLRVLYICGTGKVLSEREVTLQLHSRCLVGQGTKQLTRVFLEEVTAWQNRQGQ